MDIQSKNMIYLTLYKDFEAENTYNCNENCETFEKPLYQIEYGNKRYLIQNFQRNLATYFHDKLPKINENDEQSSPFFHKVILKHVNDTEAFDIVMKLFLGFENVSIPKNKFFFVYIIILELGIKKSKRDYSGINSQFADTLEVIFRDYFNQEASIDEIALLFKYAISTQNEKFIEMCHKKKGYKVLSMKIIEQNNNEEMNSLSEKDFDYLLKLHHDFFDKKDVKMDNQGKFWNLQDFIQIISLFPNINAKKKMEYLNTYSSYERENDKNQNIAALSIIFDFWKQTYTSLTNTNQRIDKNLEDIQNLNIQNAKYEQNINDLLEKIQGFEKKIDDLNKTVNEFKETIEILESEKSEILNYSQDLENNQSTIVNDLANYNNLLTEENNRLKIELEHYKLLQRMKYIKQEYKTNSSFIDTLFNNNKVIFKSLLSPDNKTILTPNNNGKILIKEFDINNIFKNPQLLGSLSSPKSGSILNMIFLHDNNKLATVSEDDNICRIWNLEKRKCEKILLGHVDYVYALLEIKPNFLITGSSDKNIIMWNLNDENPTNSRKIISDKAKQKSCQSLCLFNNNKFLASSDNCIHIYSFDSNTLTNFTITETLVGPSDHTITSMKKLPNEWIVTCGNDKNINIWNINNSPNALLRTLVGHTNKIFAEPLLINNSILITCSNEILIWDLKDDKSLELSKPITYIKNEYAICCMLQIAPNLILMPGEEVNFKLLRW